MSSPKMTPKGKKNRSKHKTPKHKTGETFLSRQLAINQLPVSRQSSSDGHHGSGKGNNGNRNIIPDRFRKYSMANAANMYATLRDGHILGARMIVKADYFPTKLKKKLDLQVSGAPNFRQVKPTPIFGVGQPNVYGIRTILNMMKLRATTSALAVWINLREEPILYLNDRPFVLREMDHPFRNIDDFRGVKEARIVNVEERLKKDVLREAAKHYGNIMIHMEKELGDMKPYWESVSRHSVQTSAELFERLRLEGYNIQHYRVPITAETTPSASVLDNLCSIYLEAVNKHKRVQFVFNCQRGIGRSTFGTIVLYLLNKKMAQVLNLSSFSLAGERAEDSIVMADSRDAMNSIQNLDGFDGFRRGEYDIISRLLRILKHGTKAKMSVDEAIDNCGRIENLRDAILHYRDRAERERQTDRQAVYLRYAAEKLKRYFDLVTFGAYLHTVPMVDGKFEYSFETWLSSRPEINRLSDLTQDPSEALRPADEPQYQGTLARVALGRTGAVLTKATILKGEYFRYTKAIQGLLKGLKTPNYRVVCDCPISALGQPTMNGVRAILASVNSYTGDKASPSSPMLTVQPFVESLGMPPSNQPPVLVKWITLRQEPIIYLNGEPFVIRDYSHPFRCPPEFQTGLTADRISALEERLKADVKSEAQFYGNRVVVHVEGFKRALQIKWESAPDETSILTTTEMFKELQKEGFQVEQHRVPLTVGETPDMAAFDTLCEIFLESLQNTKVKTHFVFSCQRGGRRSTVATIVMSLLLMHHGEAPFPACKLASDVVVEEVSPSGSPIGGRGSDMDSGTDQNGAEIDPELEGGSSPSEDDDGLSDDSDNDVTDNAPTRGGDDVKSKMHRRGEYKGILGLLRILSHGLLVKEDVDRCIDLCGNIHNLRESISRTTFQAESERTDQRRGRLEESIKYLESYAHLICFNSFLREMFQDNKFGQVKFSTWVNNRPELLLWLENLRKDPENMLKVDTFATDLEYASIFENRSGNVLTRGTILKSDYFVGCRSPTVPQLVEGAINFRGVDVFPVGGTGAPTASGMVNAIYYFVHAQSTGNKSNAFKDINQALTVAAAVEQGIVSGDPLSGVWFNLREEPVLYIQNSPYVLRDFDKPYVNLENTGISTRRIEAMEKTLRLDAIKEAKQYSGRLLLHDEDDDGNLMGVMVENLTQDSIRTSKSMFTGVFEAVSKFSRELATNVPPQPNDPSWFKLITGKFALPVPVGKYLPLSIFSFMFHLRDEYVESTAFLLFSPSSPHPSLSLSLSHFLSRPLPSLLPDVHYFRTPITDEQAPSMEMFDQIVRHLEGLEMKPDAAVRSFLMLNCQMGRGRTTTGMIVASLWSLHKQGASLYDQLKKSHSKRDNTRAAGHSPGSGKPAPSPALGASMPALPLPEPMSIEDPVVDTNSMQEEEEEDESEESKKNKREWTALDEETEARLTKKSKMEMDTQEAKSPVIQPLTPEEKLEMWKTDLNRGNYKMIVNLVRVLNGGDEVKEQVDLVIDHCDHMQNLRLAIFDIVDRASDTLWSKRTFYIHRGKKYLERYFFLIAFNAYFRDECPNHFNKSFVAWYKERPVLQHILDRYYNQFPPEPPTVTQEDIM